MTIKEAFPHTFTVKHHNQAEPFQVIMHSDGLHGLEGDTEGYWEYEECQKFIANGTWTIVEDAVKERDLVLPFTFHHCETGTEYVAQELENGSVRVSWEGDSEGSTYSQEDAKCYIKDGQWLVKSVGGQKPSEAPTEPCEEGAEGFTSLTIDVHSDAVVEATKRVKRLTKAVLELNEALEGIGGAFVRSFAQADCVQGFCCGEE